MRLRSKHVLARLDAALVGVTGGVPVREWAELKAADLLGLNEELPSAASRGGVEKLLAARRVQIVPALQRGARTTLEPVAGGFSLHMPADLKRSSYWYQYRLIHEVAHTLFYAIDAPTPAPTIPLSPGDPDIEWLCDYLAKAYLIPRPWLLGKAQGSARPGDRQFSLRLLWRLATEAQSPPTVVAERLVEDLGYWQCAMVRFRKHFSGSAPGNTAGAEWRMDWHTATESSTAFIPIGHVAQGAMVFPKATKRLAGALERWSSLSDRDGFWEGTVACAELRTNPTWGIAKYLANHGIVDQVEAYLAVEQGEEHGLDSETSSSRLNPWVLACFPMPFGQPEE